MIKKTTEPELKVMLITSSCNVLGNGRLTNLRLYRDGAFKVIVCENVDLSILL